MKNCVGWVKPDQLITFKLNNPTHAKSEHPRHWDRYVVRIRASYSAINHRGLLPSWFRAQLLPLASSRLRTRTPCAKSRTRFFPRGSLNHVREFDALPASWTVPSAPHEVPVCTKHVAVESFGTRAANKIGPALPTRSFWSRQTRKHRKCRCSPSATVGHSASLESQPTQLPIDGSKPWSWCNQAWRALQVDLLDAGLPKKWRRRLLARRHAWLPTQLPWSEASTFQGLACRGTGLQHQGCDWQPLWSHEELPSSSDVSSRLPPARTVIDCMWPAASLALSSLRRPELVPALNHDESCSSTEEVLVWLSNWVSFNKLQTPIPSFSISR